MKLMSLGILALAASAQAAAVTQAERIALDADCGVAGAGFAIHTKAEGSSIVVQAAYSRYLSAENMALLSHTAYTCKDLIDQLAVSRGWRVSSRVQMVRK